MTKEGLAVYTRRNYESTLVSQAGHQNGLFDIQVLFNIPSLNFHVVDTCDFCFNAIFRSISRLGMIEVCVNYDIS